MTALTAFQTNSVSGVLSTANKLSITHGTDNVNVTQVFNQIGTSTGWGEITSQGSASAWAAAGAIGAPTGRGWFLDASVLSLAGQTIAAGNYTANVRLNTGHTDGSQLGTIGGCEIHRRWFKYHLISGIYTLIVELLLSSQTINSVITTFALPSAAGIAGVFTSNEVVYEDCWVNIGTNTFGDSALTIRLNRQSTNNTGDTNTQIVTPGYSATPLPATPTQFLDAFTAYSPNWLSAAASDGSCAVRSDLSNSYNCQNGYLTINANQNTNASGVNGGLVGAADVVSGQKHGWQIHSAQSFAIPGIFAARLDTTGDTGGDGTFEKIVKSFFLFNNPGDGTSYFDAEFDFALEQNNPLLSGYPGQATPAALCTTTYGGSSLSFPNSQLAPTYLDSTMFGDFVTCVIKVELASSGGGNTTWKTTYQIVNHNGATITLGSTQTTHVSSITTVQVYFDEHWLDPTGGQQTNYNWQRFDLRWFYYSSDTTDRTPYTLGDSIPVIDNRHAGLDIIGNGFAPMIPGIFGYVALDATPGTQVAILDLYERDVTLGTLTLSDFLYALLTAQSMTGGVIVTDTQVNLDQIGGTTVTGPNAPVNVVQYGGQAAAMAGSDAQTAANVPFIVIGVFNGSTHDRLRGPGIGDGAAATGIAANQPFLFNGSTYDRLRGAAIGDGAAATGVLANASFLFNGTNYDRPRNNLDNITVLASAARTTTQTQSDQTNFNHKGIVVVLDMTVVGTGSVTLEIDGKDPVSGKYYAILTGAAVVTNSTNVYTIYPGNTVATNVSASTILPRTWRIKVTANNANSATYSVGAMLIL